MEKYRIIGWTNDASEFEVIMDFSLSNTKLAISAEAIYESIMESIKDQYADHYANIELQCYSGWGSVLID